MEHEQINSEDASCPLLSNVLRVIKEFCRTVTQQLQTEIFPCSENSASFCCGGGSPKGESPSVSHHFWPKELKNWPNLFLSAADASPALRELIPLQSSYPSSHGAHTDVLQSTVNCQERGSDTRALQHEPSS